MAWENIIVGYKLVVYHVGDTVPPEYVFIAIQETDRFDKDRLIFKKPIYKKRNIKRKK